MNGKLFAILRVSFVLLMAVTFLIPTNFALATQTVTECWQNPQAEGCEDEDTNTSADDKEVSAGVGIGVWDYLRMFFSLVLVLVLLIFVLKFLNKKSSNYQQNSVVRSIGGISVGSQKSVQLLNIGDKLYIVGVGDDVQLIKEITDPEEVQQLLDFYNEKHTVAGTTPYILELFKKFKRPNSKEGTQDPQSNQNFREMLNNRLSDIRKTRQAELEKWKEKEKDK